MATLLKDHQIRAVLSRRVVCTTGSRHALPVAANVLDRRFNPHAPHRVWAAGMTHITDRKSVARRAGHPDAA